jgi:signal transduction histidine kinase/CheY-like chemotaxis protein
VSVWYDQAVTNDGHDDAGRRFDSRLGRLVDVIDRFVPHELRDDHGQLQRARLLLLYSAVVVAICPIFVGLPLRQERYDLAVITAVAMILGSLAGPLLRRTGSLEHASLFAVSTYTITQATLFLSAGFFDLGSLYWFMGAPMFALFLRGLRSALGWLLVVTFIAVVGGLILPWHEVATLEGSDPLGDAIGAWFFAVILVAFGALYESVRRHSTTALHDALRAMEQARKQAEDAGQARSRLVASISHELRTPLGGVVGLSHLLEQTPLSTEQRELTALIGESADAVVALLNDLLEFARLDVGSVSVEQLPVDVRRVVRGVAGLFPARAEAPVPVEVVVDDAVPSLVLGDGRRLRQILWNLVGNAVKFAPLGPSGHGGVVVNVGIEGTTDAPPGESARVLLRFSVQDDGPGIDDETRQRLFQPFSQGRTDVNRRLGGTGLGLAISRNLVRALGGDEIALETRLGAGSLFTFVLPFSAAPASTTTSGKVLVVEDDPVSALVARRMVEAAGLSCDVVGDGDAAITAALGIRYDLILMDGNLPVRDGYDATRAIRRAERSTGPDGVEARRVPIVALTATTAPHERTRALEAGMDGHLHKPLDPSRLAAILHEHVRTAGAVDIAG